MRRARRSGRLPRPLRFGLAVAKFLVVAEIVLVVAFWLGQDYLIFPGRFTQGRADVSVGQRSDMEIVRLTNRSGARVAALFGRAKGARRDPRTTVLYFYGNGSCIQHTRETAFEDLRAMGFDVFVPDYVGYGMSSGRPSENGCYETATAAYEYLVRKRGIDPEHIVIAGWSLGSAVAIDLASRRPAKAIALFSPFTSIEEVGRSRMPVFPFEADLLRSRFDNRSKIGRIRCPVFIAYGESDIIVPPELSRRVAGAFTGPVTVVKSPGAGHIDMESGGDVPGRQALRRFIRGTRGDDE